MSYDNKAEFIEYLRRLTGDDFEDVVVAALQRTYTGFQKITARTHGDGGLDGLSHNCTIAYCCYGPEEDPSSPDNSRYKQKVIDKFKDDIDKLLEIRRLTKNRAEPYKNIELGKVLCPSQSHKITTIRCLTTRCNDKEIWGEINRHIGDSIKRSELRFVSQECEVVVWDAVDIANNVRLDQELLLQAENPILFRAIEVALGKDANHNPAQDLTQYDAKMDYFASASLQNPTMVSRIRETYKEEWARSLRLENQLMNIAPDLHRKIEGTRGRVITTVYIEALSRPGDAAFIINSFRSRMKMQLEKLLTGGLDSSLCEQVADAELGRSIGECPLDWRPAR